MVKRHLKRITVPKTWSIERKGSKFVVRPHPGKQIELSLPLAIIFKDLLKRCKTTKEVKYILQNNEVIVDNKKRADHRYPMGLMDVMHIPSSKEVFRMLLDKKGKLSLVKIPSKERNIKPCRIDGMTIIRGGNMQLNFLDGRNLIAKKGSYHVGDTIILDIEKGKAINHIKLEKGVYVLLIGGKHIGHHGKIKEITPKTVEIDGGDNKTMLTHKQFAFVIGKNKPVITIQ